MDLAALIVSILAVVVASSAALYTKRQADAAAVIKRIEQERRRDERRPDIDTSLDWVDGEPWLLLVNRDPLIWMAFTGSCK